MSLFQWSHVWAYNQDTMQKEEREKGRGKEKKTYRTAATQRDCIVAMVAIGTVLIAILVSKVLISAMMPDCNAESCAQPATCCNMLCYSARKLIHFATMLCYSAAQEFA